MQNHTQQRKTMPNHAKPSQTTHNYYWEHIESFLTRIKKIPSKNVLGKKKEDRSSIKSRLNKRQALEVTKKLFSDLYFFIFEHNFENK